MLIQLDKVLVGDQKGIWIRKIYTSGMVGLKIEKLDIGATHVIYDTCFYDPGGFLGFGEIMIW